jgi:hypothetical protein
VSAQAQAGTGPDTPVPIPHGKASPWKSESYVSMSKKRGRKWNTAALSSFPSSQPRQNSAWGPSQCAAMNECQPSVSEFLLVIDHDDGIFTVTFLRTSTSAKLRPRASVGRDL